MGTLTVSLAMSLLNLVLTLFLTVLRLQYYFIRLVISAESIICILNTTLFGTDKRCIYFQVDVCEICALGYFLLQLLYSWNIHIISPSINIFFPSGRQVPFMITSKGIFNSNFCLNIGDGGDFVQNKLHEVIKSNTTIELVCFSFFFKDTVKELN